MKKMGKVKFMQIGTARSGVGKSGNIYVRLFLLVDLVKRMKDHDLREKIYIFSKDGELTVHAPIRIGGDEKT